MSQTVVETFAPLIHEPAPLRNKIMKSLRRAIELGLLEPGARLVEKDLCQQLNVSRTSLREALRELQAGGILTNLNNRGLTVVAVTREEAVNIYRIRGVLEPLLMEQFLEHATDRDIEGLVKQSERLMDAYRDGNVETIVACKRDFYDHICTGARNQIGFDLLSNLTLLTSPLRRRSVVRPHRREQSVEEIRNIVSAIRKRDVAGARLAAEQHVGNSSRSVLAMLDAEAKRA